MSPLDPVRWNPFDDRPLRALARAWRTLPNLDLSHAFDAPALDVYEKDGKLVVKAAIPGMAEKDIRITVDGDLLTLAGERKEEKEVKEDAWYLKEITAGSFRRTIRLPSDVVADAADATFDSGVLTITFPKRVAEKAKTIEVKVGNGH